MTLPNSSVLLFNNNSTLASLFFWMGLGGYEPTSLKIWLQLAKVSANIYDVGANFGVFGLIAKAEKPSAKIHFFEPLIRNVRLIQKNIEVNRFSDCFVNNVAVSEQDGKANFFDMDLEENTIASFDEEFIKKHAFSKALIKIEVLCRSLDSYFSGDRTSVDLLKHRCRRA